MEQMEWREAVEEARAGADVEELDALHRRLRQQMDAVLAELAQYIDTAPDGAKAAETVRRAMFLEKLHQEIDEALEALES
jgi:molecular chaperone HscB